MMQEGMHPIYVLIQPVPWQVLRAEKQEQNVHELANIRVSGSIYCLYRVVPDLWAARVNKSRFG